MRGWGIRVVETGDEAGTGNLVGAGVGHGSENTLRAEQACGFQNGEAMQALDALPMCVSITAFVKTHHIHMKLQEGSNYYLKKFQDSFEGQISQKSVSSLAIQSSANCECMAYLSKLTRLNCRKAPIIG